MEMTLLRSPFVVPSTRCLSTTDSDPAKVTSRASSPRCDQRR
jgi:hypothetical protein